MPASGIKLADSNVWLAAVFSGHQHHTQAKAWFEAQLEGTVAFCRITQLALLRHLTNSKIMGSFVQTQQQAWITFDTLAIDPRVVFLKEPPGLEGFFRAFANSNSPSHEHWTDAYLAALSLATGTEFVTFDGDFRKFKGLKVSLLGI